MSELMLLIVIQPLVKGGNAAGQRSAGAIRAAHGLNAFVSLDIVTVHIDMAHAACHALIEHIYEIVNHFVFVHIFLFPAYRK